ncbi:MAG: hypothetical protein PHV33_05380 [Elusimicrobiales bacterium]|nr:hypothetical protein [Elusimicrobiales bacterium]
MYAALWFFTTPLLCAQESPFSQLSAGRQAQEAAVVPLPVPEGGGTLTVYAYPPRRILDWSKPRTVLKDFARIAMSQVIVSGPTVDFTSDFGEEGSIPRSYKSTMGHTIAHVRCTLPGGEAYDSWSSFSGQDFPEVDKELIMKKKVGLGALFEDYVDGHIISGVENRMRLIYYKGGGGNSPRYWQQAIDAQACGRVRDMVEFFRSFHFPKTATLHDLEARPSAQILYFTSNMDPYVSYMARKQDPAAKVGGGCAPYGLGLLKAAGKYDYSLDDVFKLRLAVSERLIGGIPDGNGRIREVTLAELTGSLGDSWTYPGYSNRGFQNYDPYKIWNFIGGVSACLSGDSGNCAPEASAWLSANGGRVSAGPVQKLSDTRTVDAGSYGDFGPQTEEVTRTVKMNGIIVN